MYSIVGFEISSKALIDGVDIRLKGLVTEICRQYSFDLLELEVMPDHVHLLIELPPQSGIHRAIKRNKCITSRDTLRSFPGCARGCRICG